VDQMNFKPTPPPELTEKQKQSPLMKYYNMDIEPVPADLVEQVMKMTYSDNLPGTPVEELNKMFDEGYTDSEFGFYTLPDGGTMFANLTPFPGVTPEMFDWWFAWHGLDSLRYTIWNKDEHYYCQTQNVEQALDTSLSLRERFWDTQHEIKESIVPGGPAIPVRLHFVNPTELGFDGEKLKDYNGTIICTPGPPSLMIHFFRGTPEGGELRTRFYSGYRAANGVVERLPADPNRPSMGGDMGSRMMLLHNIKEYRHLAKILPSLYAEYKDNFTVDLD